MKTSHLAAVSAALLCFFAPAPNANAQGNGNGNSQAAADPLIPVGVMTAYPTVVRTGTKPTLNWNILYPSTVGSVITINPPGTITITTQTYVNVQIVGTSTSTTTPGGSGGGCPTTFNAATALPSEARFSLNGGTYTQLFYGTQAQVNPSKLLYSKKLNAGTVLNFGGRYVKNGVWTPFYTTNSSNLQVVTLKNGDYPPTNTPLYGQSNLASYLSPYLDASGRVAIGPMSVLILMELGSTVRTEPCFNLQDLVLLVTFPGKSNNGHGNNLDGVDSSNPGNGHGGPNGTVDPSAGVDDEIKP